MKLSPPNMAAAEQNLEEGTAIADDVDVDSGYLRKNLSGVVGRGSCLSVLSLSDLRWCNKPEAS